MNYFVCLAEKNSGETLPMWEAWRPGSMTWSALGGPELAKVSVRGAQTSLEDWKTRLGHGVEIFDDHGTCVWWGFLQAVRQHGKQVTRSFSLEQLANRVAVRYRSLEPGHALGAWQQTQWSDDLASQAVYGVKEKIITAGMLDRSAAEQTRDLALAADGMPRLLVSPKGKEGRDGEVELECRGWLDTLDWRAWQPAPGVIGNSTPQTGSLAFGSQAAIARIAQSFIPLAKGQLAEISVRLRRVGDPVDGLRLQV